MLTLLAYSVLADFYRKQGSKFLCGYEFQRLISPGESEKYDSYE